MFTKKFLRLLALVGMLALTSITVPHASAQEDAGAFPLVSFSAFCEPGYFGPFDGCTPWEGVTVWMSSADGTFSSSCTTAGIDRAASCTLDVPFGSVITASIDPAVIPAGYVLEGAATQEFVIPDGPPQGLFSGPSFVLLPAEAPVEEIPDETIDDVPVEPISEAGFPLGAASAYCDPGYLGVFDGCAPWQGVTVSFVSSDGSFAVTCVTAGTDRAAGCGVDVPFGSTITASIDPAIIPAGYALEGPASQTFTIPSGPPEGEFGGPVFVLLPIADDSGDTPAEGFPLGAASAYCEPGYIGVFDGCTPWEGVTVSFVSADGSFSTSCVTAGTDRAAGCGVDVPFGSTITASIDPTSVPIDWTLEGAYEQTFEIPAGPPEGEFGGPVFVLLPYEGGEDTHERPAVEPVETPVPASTDDEVTVLKLPNTGTGHDAGSLAPYVVVAVAGAVISVAGAMHVRRDA